jgi:TonB-linked SusC/RagA family outer membrane protein
MKKSPTIKNAALFLAVLSGCLLVAMLPAKVFGQQQVTVSGTVSDESGNPMAGVYVAAIDLAGSGTISGSDGGYSLRVPEGNVRLSFSYLGYVTLNLETGGAVRMNAVMTAEETTFMEEVVVVGYGIQRKRDVTGSIVNIKGDNLRDLPVANLATALQGKASGLDIVSAGGSPGAEPTIRIRGTGTINSSDPLVVIDGVPAGSISDVNPNDIATIEILKDASSSAIYGTRAANGVVIITTKRGATGVKPNLDVNLFHGFAGVSKTLDLLTAPDLAMLKKERYTNDGIAVNPFWNDPYYSTQRTDWQDAMFNTSHVTNVDLRMSGGNNNSNFMSSIGYYDEQGLIINSDFQRVSLRLNSDHQITPRLKVGQNLQYTYRQYYNPNTQSAQIGLVWEAMRFNPALPLRTDNGGWGSAVANNELGDINNPIYELETERHSTKRHNLLASVTLDYKILDGFFLKGNLAYNRGTSTAMDFMPVVMDQMRQRAENELSQSYSENQSFLGEAYLAYQKVVDKHSINATAGLSGQKRNGQSFNAMKKNLADESDDQLILNNGATLGAIGGNYSTEQALASYFGRLFYSYDDRYLLTATFRMDGSSKFMRGKRWGAFPAFSLGWRLSEENFLKDASWISDLKLVGGWGLLGNQEVADLQYLSVIANQSGYGTRYIFGTEQVGSAVTTTLANTNITWEKTAMTNIGIDGAFFNNSLTASVTWFDKKTVDMLIPTVVVGSMGRARIPDSNIGEMLNRGLEIELGYRRQFASGFSLNAAGNVSFMKNKVLKLYGSNNYINSSTYGRQAQEISRTYEGQPIASFYGWKTDGLYQNDAEIASDPNIKKDPRKNLISPGDVRFVDQNDDGIIDEDDRVYIGDPNPNVILGLQVALGYKGFDLSMNFVGSLGAQLFNADRMQGIDPTYSYNMYAETLGRWHGEGTSNSIPRMTTQRSNLNHRTSDLFIESGDYLQLRTLTLGYTLPSGWLSHMRMNNLRVYVSAENLFMLTSYSGITPELGYSHGNRQRGVDYAGYPTSRKFTMGLNLNF